MFESIQYISCGKFISDGDWIHPDRTIDSFEIIYVVKGTVFLCENGTDFAVGKNEFLILEPNLRHFGSKNSRDTEFYWLHWQGGGDIPLVKHSKIENSYAFTLFLNQLLHYRITGAADECFDYLTRLILCEAASNSSKSASPVLAQVASWISANSHKAITVAQIAKRFGYNADYLNRAFRQCYNKSMKQFIDEERMKCMKTMMLNGDMSLKEIAAACGFSEYKYFLKFFKYHEGFTPKEFRVIYSDIYVNTN